MADLTDRAECGQLIEHVSTGSPPLNMFVNNAGMMQYFAQTATDALTRLERELALELHAPMHLATALPPRLERTEAAIVNVTTGLVYAPFENTPGHSSAKGGLHAFTQSLR